MLEYFYFSLILLPLRDFEAAVTQEIKVSVPNNAPDDASGGTEDKIYITDLEMYNVDNSSLSRYESKSNNSTNSASKNGMNGKLEELIYIRNSIQPIVGYNSNFSRVYRISMVINEPFHSEYKMKDDEKLGELADGLVETIKEILNLKLKKIHSVHFITIEDVPDPFESLVHLDIQTESTEIEIRGTLQEHLNVYYAFGKFIVNPKTLLLRAIVACEDDEISCDIRRCIFKSQICDYKIDCDDGTDENNCNYPVRTICLDNEIKCNDEKCILKNYMCDGKIDCLDGSDELYCGLYTCKPNEFLCKNKQCIVKIYQCDGDYDCEDQSDEEDCTNSLENFPCTAAEFKCQNDQCVSKSSQCDQDIDCLDGSDETDCSPTTIVQSPPSMVILNSGTNLTLTCKSTGIPTPVIFWRYNWGNLPKKCSSTSINGTGTLFCPNMSEIDQGVFTCEAVNFLGYALAVPDTLLIVKKIQTCSKERKKILLERCKFCTEQPEVPKNLSNSNVNLAFFDKTMDIAVIPIRPILRSRKKSNSTEVNFSPSNGIHIVGYYNNSKENVVQYINVPSSIVNNNEYKLVTGYLEYEILYRSNSRFPLELPNLIIKGNNKFLVYNSTKIVPNQVLKQKVEFYPGNWYRKDNESVLLANLTDITEVFENLENLLIRVKYDNSPYLNVFLNNIIVISEDVRVFDLCAHSYFEECHYSTGYIRFTCGPSVSYCNERNHRNFTDNFDQELNSTTGNLTVKSDNQCNVNNYSFVLSESGCEDFPNRCLYKNCYNIFRTIENKTIIKSIPMNDWNNDNMTLSNCITVNNDTEDNSVHISSSTTSRTTTTTEFDICQTKPCRNGFCTLNSKSLLTYTCVCNYGYVGRKCENLVKQCELWKPCRNGGTCTNFFDNNLRSYRCSCQFPFTGANCEKKVELYNDVKFNGDSWLQLNTSLFAQDSITSKELIGFELSTNSSEGLIFWSKYMNQMDKRTLYTILAITDGFVEFQYDLTTGSKVLREKNIKLNDGKRHRIIFHKQGRFGTLMVDTERIDIDTRRENDRHLYDPVVSFIGGVPDYSITQDKYNEGLDGCIHNFEVQDFGTLYFGNITVKGKNLYACTRKRWKPSSLILGGDDNDELAYTDNPKKPTVNSASSPRTLVDYKYICTLLLILI